MQLKVQMDLLLLRIPDLLQRHPDPGYIPCEPVIGFLVQAVDLFRIQQFDVLPGGSLAREEIIPGTILQGSSRYTNTYEHRERRQIHGMS